MGLVSLFMLNPPPCGLHPYGTIKSWMGATHFKMRRLKNVATEMALHVLAYNMTRVMNLIGTPALIAAMKA